VVNNNPNLHSNLPIHFTPLEILVKLNLPVPSQIGSCRHLVRGAQSKDPRNPRLIFRSPIINHQFSSRYPLYAIFSASRLTNTPRPIPLSKLWPKAKVTADNQSLIPECLLEPDTLIADILLPDDLIPRYPFPLLCPYTLMPCYRMPSYPIFCYPDAPMPFFSPCGYILPSPQ